MWLLRAVIIFQTAAQSSPRLNNTWILVLVTGTVKEPEEAVGSISIKEGRPLSGRVLFALLWLYNKSLFEPSCPESVSFLLQIHSSIIHNTKTSMTNINTTIGTKKSRYELRRLIDAWFSTSRDSGNFLVSYEFSLLLIVYCFWITSEIWKIKKIFYQVSIFMYIIWLSTIILSPAGIQKWDASAFTFHTLSTTLSPWTTRTGFGPT